MQSESPVSNDVPAHDEIPQRPLLATLSPSRASDFKQCPQMFKFKSIDKIESPPTIYQARGTTAHLALQRLFDLPGPEREPQRLYDLFREAWVELKDQEYPDLFESVDDERAWGIESLHVLANYFSVEDPRTLEPVDRELDMLEDLDGIVIRGILDRMEETDDGLIITDYKTGKAPPQRFADKAFFALKIYALLIRHRTGTTPDGLKLIYLNGPTVYQIPVDNEQLDAMDAQLRALWTTINTAIETNVFPPQTSKLCDWCSYQTICPAFASDDVAPS
jgi:putative RecB family exonuclease